MEHARHAGGVADLKGVGGLDRAGGGNDWYASYFVRNAADIDLSNVHTVEDVLAAIDQLQLQHATAIGSAILVSLKAIFPQVDFDVRKKPQLEPVPPGSHTSAAIILLSDGQTTAGPDPVEAARLAAERGVRVFTVGVGTENGQILTGEGWSMRVRLDEDSLKAIADLTRAEYFYAGTAIELKKVYQSLRSKLVLEKKQMELTALFSAIGAATVLLSATLSLLWFNRIL